MPLTTEQKAEIASYINIYRAKHNSQNIVNNPTMCSSCSSLLAQSLSITGRRNPTIPKNYSENVFMGKVSQFSTYDPVVYVKRAIDAWYKEKARYNFTTNSPGIATSNFTNMIWNSSTEFGLGCVLFNGMVYICMSFNPPGSVSGQYAANIAPADP